MRTLALLFLVACSPDVIQHVEVRDPHQVAVYDREARPLLPAGGEPAEKTIHYSAPLWGQDIVIRRESNGAVVLGDGKSVIDPAGRFDLHLTNRAEGSVDPPRLDGEAFYFTYPVLVGRKHQLEGTRFLFATPRSNVITAREERVPTANGAALVFGLLFAGIGAALVTDGLVRRSVQSGERVAEVTLGGLFLLPGVAGVVSDVYGMVAPRTSRVIVQPPP